MRSLIQASDTVFSNPPAYKGTIKPGSSDYVAELYNAHKDVARLWCNAGKPRNGDLFELRRVSKARYKYALRFIKRNEADMRKESLGNKLADSDSRDFWKEIKGVGNAKMPLPTYYIEGVTGESNIGSSLAAEGVNLAREYPQWVFGDYASQDRPHQESD